MAPKVGVWVRACKSVYVRACVFMSTLACVFVCVFGGCVVSAYAFMSAVGVYVCVCACVLPCVRELCIKCHKFILNWLSQK